ncbi:MAG: hypothetical protein LBL90_02435 [Prevotellaceae bacterium]|jgi:hypothetical protein|nr:hypothetical protein [Prevotellaceae bacterium]
MMIAELREKLGNGWTIFSDTELVVYEDQPQYAAEAVFFKRKIGWCSPKYAK